MPRTLVLTAAAIAAALLLTHATAADAATRHHTTKYALGTASAKAPFPDCSDVTANWTAANGPVWVTVMVGGPVKTTVTVTAGANRWKASHRLGATADTHIFKFKAVDPSAVTSVLLTSSASQYGKAGSCVVTGSPTN